MRRIFWTLTVLSAALLIPTRGWEASISQNIAIAVTAATEQVAFAPTSLTFSSQNVGTSSPAQAITMTNTGTVPFPVASIGIIGADPGDFADTNTCPSSLAVSTSCDINVVFGPTATGTRTASLAVSGTGGGTYTVPLSGTAAPPLAPGFYVATNGSDSNAGTLAAPFATLAKCQTAMESSSMVKTCYVRAGTYTLADASHSCGIYMLNADDGETWSGYPPDGEDTAILDGSTNSLNCAFFIDGYQTPPPDNITITNLQMQNFSKQGVYVVNSSNITVSDNIIHDIVSEAPIQFECIYTQGNWGGFTISHNYIYNVGGIGVRMDDFNIGPPPCTITAQISIDHNYIRNVCETSSDCGAIYMEGDQPPSSIPLLVEYNYARDLDMNHVENADGAWYTSMIYQDGRNENMLALGNIMVSDDVEQCWAPGGSTNSIFKGNICDFVTNKYGNSLGLDLYDQGAPVGGMIGNQATNNLLVMDTVSGNVGGGWKAASWSVPQAPMYVSNNGYFNYGPAGSVNYSCAGTNACGASGTSTTQDNAPTYENPQISCWSPQIPASSPVFSAPVEFPALPEGWGTPGFWGPPGFTIPQIGTAPSWPHAC